MDLSPPGAAFVRVEEGFVGIYYFDAVRVGTIGIGFTWASMAFRQWWADNKPGMKFGPGATMTRDEAERCLIYCFANEYGKAVNDFLGKAVPQNVFDGMASPVYNLGTGALQWKWAAFAKAGDYPACAAALRVTGTTAKGKTLVGLVRRRKEEAALIEGGFYAGVKAAPEDAMSDSVLVRGERGPAVASLISDLADLGYYKGKLDDVFGYGTEAAVLAFQRDHGLTDDGFAGQKTLDAINAALVPKLAAPAPEQPAPAPIPAPVSTAPKPIIPAASEPKTAPAVITPKPAPPKPSLKPSTAAGLFIMLAAALAAGWHHVVTFFHNLF